MGSDTVADISLTTSNRAPDHICIQPAAQFSPGSQDAESGAADCSLIRFPSDANASGRTREHRASDAGVSWEDSTLLELSPFRSPHKNIGNSARLV
jgi:hypothetical protein